MSAGAAWMLARRGGPGESAPLTLTRLTFDSGLTTDPAISPDGKLVAYASDRSSEGSLDIWVQQVAGGAPIQLTRDPSDDSEPTFSPDGSQIAFRSERDGGGVYVVPALGGEARRIARQGRRPRYSPDGKWIAYWTGEYQLVPAKLYVAAASGSEARQLAADFFSARYPVWSPDSKRLVFLGTQNRENPDYRWWIVAAEGGSAAAVAALRSAIPEAWLSEADRIVFSGGQGDARNLWEALLAGQAIPRRLTFGPGVHAGASLAGASVMVFADLSENLDIWSLPIDADRAKVTGELRRLTQDPSREGRPSVSSDGRRIAFNTFRSGSADAWVKDLATGRDTAVGVTPAPEAGPIVNADGTRVTWSTNDDSIWVAPAAGGDAERVCQGCRLPTGWSHDGKWIAYELTANRSAPLVEVGGGRKIDILKHATYGVSRVRFSPDDRWLSFHTVSGPATRQIFIVPFKGAVLHEEKDWIPITDGKAIDRYADWSPDGKLLYFLSEREGFRCLWAQRLDPATKRPQGAAFPVYHFHHARRSLMAMGDPVNGQPTVARDKIVFAMAETTGNIWLARPEAR
jgi:Tol biopolymer transport system component